MTNSDVTPTSPPRPLGEAIGRTVVVFMVLVLVFGAIALGILSTYAFGSETEESTDTYSSADVLDLDIGAGNVDIEVHDRDEIIVDREVTYVFVEPEADHVSQGDTLTLRSDLCEAAWWFVGAYCRADYEIKVPQGTEITGSVSHGHVSISDIEAPVDLESRHGGVDISNVTGDLTIDSHHGDVEFTDITGGIDVNARHGHVDATNISGPVNVIAHHGNFELTGGTGTVAVESRHGHVDIQETTAQFFEIEAHHGDANLSATAHPEQVTIDSRHGHIEVLLPTDAPTYDVRIDISHGNEDINVPTDPGANRYLNLKAQHGDISVNQ